MAATIPTNGIVLNSGLNVADGNITLADGHGIDFAATGDGSHTMATELLDDYYINKEELILRETEKTGDADYNLIPKDEDGKRISYTSKFGKKDAMYISVIQQLISRIEALEDA